MSLDIYIERPSHIGNITHNLNTMAEKAGIYQALWRSDEIKENITAGELIPILEEGLAKLKADPEFYKQYNPPNGWGSYDNLVNFTQAVLDEFRVNPDSRVSVSR